MEDTEHASYALLAKKRMKQASKEGARTKNILKLWRFVLEKDDIVQGSQREPNILVQFVLQYRAQSKMGAAPLCCRPMLTGMLFKDMVPI